MNGRSTLLKHSLKTSKLHLILQSVLQEPYTQLLWLARVPVSTCLIAVCCHPEFTPSGWESSSSDLSISLRKSIESMTFLVKVESDFSFQITVGDYAISNLSYFVAVKLDSVPAVIKVLEKCVGSQICIGNPDEKFDQTRLRRSGIFIDQTGKVAHSI